MECFCCTRFVASDCDAQGFLNLPLDYSSVLQYDRNSDRGVAQLGSAPLWGSGGRGFESRRSDSQKTLPASLLKRLAGFLHL